MDESDLRTVKLLCTVTKTSFSLHSCGSRFQLSPVIKAEWHETGGDMMRTMRRENSRPPQGAQTSPALVSRDVGVVPRTKHNYSIRFVSTCADKQVSERVCHQVSERFPCWITPLVLLSSVSVALFKLCIKVLAICSTRYSVAVMSFNSDIINVSYSAECFR